MSLNAVYPTGSGRVDLPALYAFPLNEPQWVRANFIASLDGATTVAGRSGGLGNVTDTRIFALLRALSDVILVGAGTAYTEEYGPADIAPEWAHTRAGRTPTPPIAIVSGSLNLDPSAPLFTAAPEHARTIVLTCQASPPRRRHELAAVAEVIIAGEDTVELPAALDALTARGHRHISCEGGPRLLAQIAAAERLDELCLTLSPLLVAGDAPRVANGPTLPNAVALELSSVLEDDGFLFLRYLRAREPSA